VKKDVEAAQRPLHCLSLMLPHTRRSL